MGESKTAKLQRLGVGLANVILAGGGALCLVTLSNFVYYYSWTGQRHFTSLAGIVADYFLPAIMAALLLGALKLHPSFKLNVALLLCSVIASLYVMEASLTLW